MRYKNYEDLPPEIKMLTDPIHFREEQRRAHIGHWVLLVGIILWIPGIYLNATVPHASWWLNAIPLAVCAVGYYLSINP